MGVLVPLREISVADLKALRAEVRIALMKMVSEKTGKPVDELVVRDILPDTDLNIGDGTGESWDNKTELVLNVWTMDWRHELDEDEGVAFYGVSIHDDAYEIMFMRYKLGKDGATVKDLVGLQQIQNNDQRWNVGFHRPVYYAGKQYIYIDYYTRATVAVADCHVQLLGMFCEPRGEQIS